MTTASAIAPVVPAPGSATAGAHTATSVASPTGGASHDQPSKPATRHTAWPAISEQAQMAAALASTAASVNGWPLRARPPGRS